MFKHVVRFGFAVTAVTLSTTLFAGLAGAGQLFSISYPEVLRDGGAGVTSISFPEVLREAGLTPKVASIVWPRALRSSN